MKVAAAAQIEGKVMIQILVSTCLTASSLPVIHYNKRRILNASPNKAERVTPRVSQTQYCCYRLVSCRLADHLLMRTVVRCLHLWRNIYPAWWVWNEVALSSLSIHLFSSNNTTSLHIYDMYDLGSKTKQKRKLKAPWFPMPCRCNLWR